MYLGKEGWLLMKIRDLHLTELTPIKLVKYITKKAWKGTAQLCTESYNRECAKNPLIGKITRQILE